MGCGARPARGRGSAARGAAPTTIKMGFWYRLTRALGIGSKIGTRKPRLKVNRYSETETKSLGHEHRVKEPVPKASIFVKNGWPGFGLRIISCLACIFLTISPTHHF